MTDFLWNACCDLKKKKATSLNHPDIFISQQSHPGVALFKEQSWDWVERLISAAGQFKPVCCWINRMNVQTLSTHLYSFGAKSRWVRRTYYCNAILMLSGIRVLHICMASWSWVGETCSILEWCETWMTLGWPISLECTVCVWMRLILPLEFLL